MADVTKKVLVLKFGYTTDADKKATVNISKIKEGLTDEQIKSAMEQVVSAGALCHKDESSPVNKIVEANYVNTVTEEITL